MWDKKKLRIKIEMRAIKKKRFREWKNIDKCMYKKKKIK